MGKLYLIPNTLGDSPLAAVLPADVLQIIKNTKVFASENPKNTRRFLKKIDKNIDIDTLTFLELSEHSSRTEIEACLPWLERTDIGIISEAGCPGIADPGADLVAIAHNRGFQVIPLVGPSSILLALIASGFNGQNFSFNGYLPVKSAERIRALRNFEKQSATEHRTQIFIETPYRNQKLFEEMLHTLHQETLLSIACDLTTPMQYIKTLPIRDWKQQHPNINKRPAIFSIYASLDKKER